MGEPNGESLIQRSVFRADSEDGTNTVVHGGERGFAKNSRNSLRDPDFKKDREAEVSSRTRQEGKGALCSLKTRMCG